MIRFRARLALASLAVAVVLALGVVPAYAGYPDTVKGAQHDCGAGHYPLQGHYSVAVLVKALAGLSTSDVEYTTCKDALEAAIRAAEAPKQAHHTATSGHTTTHTSTTGTHTGTGDQPNHAQTATSGSTGATGAISSQQIDAAVANGAGAQKVAGVVYTPGAITTHGSSFLSSIPDPVLAVLAALIAVLAAFGALAVRNIVRARRTG